MKPEIVYSVIVAVMLALAGLMVLVRCERNRANIAEAKILESKAMIEYHEEIAKDLSQANADLKKAIADRDGAIADSDFKVGQAISALKAVREKAKQAEQKGTPEPMPEKIPDDEKKALQAVAESLEEGCRIRDTQIMDLKARAYLAETIASQLQKAMIEKDAQIAAAQGMVKGALWKGRIQGFVVGVASDRAASLLIR